MSEQLKFNFEPKNEAKPPELAETPHKYEFEEDDECKYCGNPKKLGMCNVCAKYKEKNTPKKH